MIPQPRVPAIFRYDFRPVADDYRRFEQDAGFSLTVYQNNSALFVMYNLPCVERTRATFLLDDNFARRYYEILDNNDYWLKDAETNIRLPQDRNPQYYCTFGFSGYPLVTCDDPVRMMRMHLGTPEGFNARRICCLFEDIVMLLKDYGINLQFNDWDSANPPEEYKDFTQDWMNPNAMGM